jgi:hypothetical protein
MALLLAPLLMSGSPANADAEADAAFLAEVTVSDTTMATMRSLAMPATERVSRAPHQGRLLTTRAREEYLAIFGEQFDYLMRNDILIAQKQVFLKLYSPDELAKIRSMFESEAWAILQSRSGPHQEALVTAGMTKSDAIAKYIMARLETRAREEKFEIWEEPGMVQRLQNVLGSEKP